jgi:hypothetical protein
MALALPVLKWCDMGLFLFSGCFTAFSPLVVLWPDLLVSTP